jgi:hypothetical protein
MIYTLRHFDTPLMRFSAENGAEASIRLLWLDESHRELLPLDFHRQADAEQLESLLCHRTIPKTAHM